MKPSLRAAVVTRRTYNRPLDNNTFETWEQTVDRVIGHQKWLWERAQGYSLDFAQSSELDDLRNLMLERKVLTSGRTLWLGGTEISKRREASQFNPFVAGTKLLTKEHGLVNIEDVDGQSFHVVGRDGKFHEAFGSYSGKQKTYEIFMSRGRSATRFTASENHRWWLEDGSRVPTSSLKIGDKIPVVVPEGVAGTKEGFLHGFIYGDGSVNNKQTGGTYLLRLCGEKSKHFAALSEFATSHSYPPSASGDAFLYFGSISNFREDFKSTPETTDPTYIAGFIRGLMAADGCKDGKQISGSKDTIDYIEKYAHLAGLLVTSRRVHKNQETNFGKRSQPLHSAVFSTWDEPMRVRAIEEREVEDVWCCTVPGEESFLLEGGVVTSNCSFTQVETVMDVVDVLWLLLQGCGVGFRPIVGQLTGYQKPIQKLTVIRSTRKEKGGVQHNRETYEDGVWTIKVGDSAEAWAKSIGKILAHKYPARELVLDFSEIRPAGERLAGYGWISSGDSAIAQAYEAIHNILNRRAGSLLTRMDILDVVNWLGTVLSSRRSAEIALFEYGEDEWAEFAVAKKDFFINNIQRGQSNNSLLFKTKPSYSELQHIFDLMIEAGGSEPGFINGREATKRAPWFKGCNPLIH